MSAELERKKEFAAAMFYYAHVLPHCAPDFKDRAVLRFWFDRLSSLKFVDLKRALDRLVTTCRRFPTINEIECSLGVAPRDSETEARLIVANITTAISRHGSWHEVEAKENLGPLAWNVVRLAGGWQRVCESGYDELPILQAQWRHLAESSVRDNRIIGNPNALPESRTPNVKGIIDLALETSLLNEGHDVFD